MCYSLYMDTTIRNLDEAAYRELKAQAALAGKTIGEVMNDAMRAYLAQRTPRQRRGTLRELGPEAYPDGNEQLSEEVDAVVYGTRR